MEILDLRQIQHDRPSNDVAAEVRKAVRALIDAMDEFKSETPEGVQTKISSNALTVVNNSKPYARAVTDQGLLPQTYDDTTVMILESEVDFDRRRLSPSDMETETAIGRLVDLAEPNASGLVCLTFEQIAREKCGYINSGREISDQQLAEVKTSVYMLMKTDAVLKYKMRVERDGDAQSREIKLKGAVLLCDIVMLDTGGATREGIAIAKSQLPKFYQYARHKGGLISVDKRHLDTTRDNTANLYGLKPRQTTEIQTLIKNYLIKQIKWQLAAPKSAKSVLYQTIYDAVGRSNPTPKQMRVMDEHIAYFLELWKRQGVIGGYTAKTQGKTVKKITFTPPQ